MGVGLWSQAAMMKWKGEAGPCAVAGLKSLRKGSRMGVV